MNICTILQAFEQHKRRSQGGGGMVGNGSGVIDNKYGFALSGQVQSQMDNSQYPVMSSQPRSPPDLPPRVDRNAKPNMVSPRGTLGRSAQERLVNKTDSILDMGNYINATPHRANAGTSSLERVQAKAVTVHEDDFWWSWDWKYNVWLDPQGSYDSMSSYDSYNNTNGTVSYNTSGLNTSTGRLGPNVPDDMKSGTLSVSSRPHDPYRFTRSTAQPIPAQEAQARTDYAKYRYTCLIQACPSLLLFFATFLLSLLLFFRILLRKPRQLRRACRIYISKTDILV